MAQSSPYDFDIYQPRNPKASAYYKCVDPFWRVGILKSWSKYGMTCIKPGTAIGALMSWLWFINIWIVVIFISDLPGSNAKIAVMSIYWRFLVSAANFVHLAIRKGLLNMANGCLPMSWRMLSADASLRAPSAMGPFYIIWQYSQTIADLFSLWPQITGKAQYLWMEGTQRIFEICCTIWWCCSRRQHCGADLRGFSKF